jgi:hypothetical protein
LRTSPLISVRSGVEAVCYLARPVRTRQAASAI